MKSENEWPISRTQYTKLYLDTKPGSLKRQSVSQEQSFSYDARSEGPGPHRAQFDLAFDTSTELIGHMKLKLWMAPDGADDMDVFVAIQKLDSAGNLVPFAFWSHFDDGPIALGWLRASHRELDETKSTAYQPVLVHLRELKIENGAIVPLEIEIWPSGTRFEAGEQLRLVVQGVDVYQYPKPTMADRHEDTVNRGRHVIYAGGKYDSHLLVPVIPEETR
jgi:predicted acyl esterase